MLGSKASYGDRFQASSTTIVAKGYSRNTMQGISHISNAKRQHLFAINDMKGSRTLCLMLATAFGNSYLTKLMGSVRNSIITNLPLSRCRQPKGHYPN